jgi:Cytochrome c554 and c-prime
MSRISRLCTILVGFVVVVVALPSMARKNSGQTLENIPSFAKYLQIPGAKTIGADTCMSCHEAVAMGFQHAFHAQQGVECEQCHGNGSLHVDGGGYVTKIVAFSKRSADEANGVCLSCHARARSCATGSAGRTRPTTCAAWIATRFTRPR